MGVHKYNMRIHHAFLLVLLVCQFGLGLTEKKPKDKDAEEPETEAPGEGAADPAGDHCIKALEALIADLKAKEGGSAEEEGSAEGEAEGSAEGGADDGSGEAEEKEK